MMVKRLAPTAFILTAISTLGVTGSLYAGRPADGTTAFCGAPLHLCERRTSPCGSSQRRAVVYAMARGSGNKVKDKEGEEKANPVFSWFIKEKGSANTSDRGKGAKAKAAADEGWWPRPFGWGQDEKSKKKTATKKKANGFWPFPGFADFNELWKGANERVSLQKKIRKLEQEVVKDYKRGDRARAAQYRFEVMQTLEEVNKVTRDLEQARPLDIKDAKILDTNKEIFDKDGRVVKPEDLDKLLAKERSLLQAMALDEQQWARLGSACVGSALGLAAFPNHDFFSVLAAGAFMTFLTTQSGLVGDLARMSGYGVVSGVKAIGSLERRFEVLSRVGDLMREAIEVSVPFRLPWSEAPSWRNAYRGEGFLHPDIRPAPPMKDFQYVEYLREVKRWLDAEEKAVLIALRKKEDARIQEELDREAMKEQVQKVFTGVWSAASGLVAAAAEAQKTGKALDDSLQREALDRFDTLVQPEAPPEEARTPASAGTGEGEKAAAEDGHGAQEASVQMGVEGKGEEAAEDQGET